MAISSNNVQVYTTLSKELVAEIDKDAKENFRTRSQQINAALQTAGHEERFRLVPSRDISGHGTAVAGIAAGNGRGSQGGRYRGVAPEAELLIVKMGIPGEYGFPRTTQLMRGVDYIIRKAEELKKPVAVNISFGNTYGSHEPYN